MSFGYSAGGRVSGLAMSQRLLTALRREQAALSRTQLQISSGQQISQPSEDPTAASRIIDLQAALARVNQLQDNADYANSVLSSVDTALGEAADVLREANTLAISSVGSSASDAERQANVQVLDSLIGQMQRLANRNFQGRYLFDGQAGQGDPFTEAGGGIAYGGSANPFDFLLEGGWDMPVQLDGATVFGALSAPAGSGKDLDPIMTLSTRLADLNGAAGAGVTLGEITVDDGINPTVTIDLGSAATVGDAVDLFNASAPAGVTMSLAGSGVAFTVSGPPGSALVISDVEGGSAARDLGIAHTTGGTSFTGGDVDPRLTETTSVASLNAGSGFDQAPGITITNGSLAATVTFGTASTLQNVLNAINRSGTGVKASIDEAGKRLVVVNALAGTELKIAEHGGNTADDLGVRTFHGGLALSGLNGGRGIGNVQGLADLRITQRDGTTIDVNLDSATTINQVVTAINTAPGNTGDLAASISQAGGIQLVDGSAGGASLSVTGLNQSAAAANLGLLQTVPSPGDTLTGEDVSGVRGDGVFSHLLRLRDALVNNDTWQITHEAESVQADLDRLVELRGTVGAQAAQVQRQVDRNDRESLDGESLLSQVRDVDLTEAVLTFQRLQQQLTASMTTAGQLLSVSLLDFLS